MSVSRAFLHISFRVPSEGAVPPGSPRRAPIETERDRETDAPFPELYFICLSKAPVKRAPSRFPKGVPVALISVSRAFCYISFDVSSEQGLLIKSHLSLKVPGKADPLPWSPKGASMETAAPFQSSSCSENMIKATKVTKPSTLY